MAKYFVFTVLFFCIVYSGFSQNENIQQKYLRVNPNVCLLTGKVLSENNNIVKDAILTIIEGKSKNFLGSFEVEPTNGGYSISLTKNIDYQIIIETNGYFTYLMNVNIASSEGKETEKNIIIPDSYKKYFKLDFEKISFNEKHDSIVNFISDILSVNEEMKLKLIFQDDSISGLLADSMIKAFDGFGINSNRLINDGENPEEKDDHMLSLEIRHQIIPVYEPEKKIVKEEKEIVSKEKIEEISEKNIVGEEITDMEGDPVYTIQLSATKKPLKPGFFESLDNVKVYHGKDGYYRYTYGKFVTLKFAEFKLEEVKKRGYKNAYIKKISSYIEK